MNTKELEKNKSLHCKFFKETKKGQYFCTYRHITLGASDIHKSCWKLKSQESICTYYEI